MKKYIGDMGKFELLKHSLPAMTEAKKIEYKNIIINNELGFCTGYDDARKHLILYIEDRIKGLNNSNDDPYMIDACQCYLDILNEYYPNNTITGMTNTGETYQLNNHEKWVLVCEEFSDYYYQYTNYHIKIDYTGSNRELNGVIGDNWVVTVKGDLQYI